MIIGDLETDGLFPHVTKIHCGVFYDTDSDTFTKFTPENVKDIPTYLDTVKSLSMHNGVGFDFKVLKKVFNYTYTGVYIDTLLMSRLLWPDLENAGYVKDDGEYQGVKNPHGVESWGLRFGISKPEHEDWSVYTPEMLHRCTEDVRIQTALWQHIAKTVREFAIRDSRTENRWQSIINMEQMAWGIIEKQADTGWMFDLQAAYQLEDELSTITKATEDRLIPLLPMKVVRLTENPTKATVKNGSLSATAKQWLGSLGIENIAGDFCKVRFDKFNLGSSAQVKDYLLANGWEPSEWNYKKDKHNKPVTDSNRQRIKTSPVSPSTSEEWEEIAHRLNKPEIALLAEYGKASHRLSSVRGLIKNVRSDHRIEARANTCSTNTGRMSHSVVVNIPKAKASVYYGKQMRSLFIAEEGRLLVGADASALEARCEAHYIYNYNPAAADMLINGDIHTANAEVFGVDRDTAKSAKYAILYGCSPSKLSTVLKKPIGLAKGLYDEYWDANTASKMLKEDLEAEYKKWGYILAIDGRPLTIRYTHAILNSLLQSCGAIAMKIALCIADNDLKVAKIDAHSVGNFHDEMQYECYPKDAETVGKILVEAIRKAGRYLRLNVPLDGEYKIGKSWAETH